MLNITQPYNNQAVQAVTISRIQDRIQRARAMREGYIKAQEYYSGVHDTMLTDRQRAFLGVKLNTEFNVNYCPMVVNAKADRLSVSAFDTEDNQKEMLWKWWRKNRMDRVQGIVHRASVRDGDAFVLVEWDSVAEMPRFYFQHADNGEGVMVHYSDEHRDEIEFATKTWCINYGTGAGSIVRLNIYLPDRVEKYYSNTTITDTWYPHTDEDAAIVMDGQLGKAGVYWWTDTGAENGKPLGIPIVHFKHNDIGDCYGNSHLTNVIPVQDAVNKSVIDLLGAMDANGFPLLVGYGSTEWQNVKVGPGSVAAISRPRTDGVELDSIPPMAPTGLLDVYNALVMEIARISGTPLSYFQTSGQVAAEGTMKQQEIALISQVKKSQTDYGNAWEDVLTIARRLHNVFGAGGLDEETLIDTIWDDAESRNEKAQAETLAIKVSTLGVPQFQAWTELGYDETQQAAFAREQKRKEAEGLRNNVKMLNAQAQAQNMTQTESMPMQAAQAGTQAAA